MSDLGTQRLFLAVALDGETRDLLAAHLREQAPRLPGRIAAPTSWHITLRFLGSTTPLQRDGVLRSIDESPLPPPFTVRFGEFGAFPKPRRASVLWLGFDRGVDELAAIADVCETAARAEGFAAEERSFIPHLTLSRIRPPQDVTALLGSLPPFPLKMGVEAVTLFRSRPERGVAVYDAIETVDL